MGGPPTIMGCTHTCVYTYVHAHAYTHPYMAGKAKRPEETWPKELPFQQLKHQYKPV